MNQKIHQIGDFRQVEQTADAAISPGHLVEQTSTGVKKHATEGGFAERMFAQEDALQGKTVDDDYAEDDMVSVCLAQRGTLVLAMLAAGTAYVKGTRLISAGDGTLKATTGSPSDHVAVCAEAKDLSASGASAALGLVRVQ